MVEGLISMNGTLDSHSGNEKNVTLQAPQRTHPGSMPRSKRTKPALLRAELSPS